MKNLTINAMFAVLFLVTTSMTGCLSFGAVEMHTHIGKVNDLEHKADLIEAKAASYVFTNGEDQPLAASHMYRLIQRLDDVANAAETAANSLLPIISK